MNERYKELFKKAGGKTSTRNLVSNPVKVVETHELWDNQIEKFAELIVRECARVARNTDLEDVEGGDSAVLRAAGEQIEQYFGVKE